MQLLLQSIDYVTVRLDARVRKACGVLLLLVHTAPLQAQNAAELANLIFDPVPLAVSQTDDGSRVARELTPLPAGEPLTLEAWLASNGGNASRAETTEDSIKRYEALVLELEINEGPYSAQLPQQLLSLGAALQGTGDFPRAQEHFEKAMHVARVNHGLFSEAQIPYIEQSIDNQLRQGNLLAADDLQRYLFYLKQKNHGHDSTALLPAMERYAEWNIFAFNAPVASPSLTLTTGTAQSPSVDPAMFRLERLMNAQNIYWSIAQIIVANFGLSDPRLLDAEKRIALTNYFFATAIATDAETMNLNLNSGAVPTSASSGVPTVPAMGNMGYRQGRDALDRRRKYARDMGLSPEEQLKASLDVADWMLFFDRQRMKALELYGQTREEFTASLAPAELEAVLNPHFPQLLPTFIRPSWSRAALGIGDDQALEYKGHIDVEFTLSRFGKPQQITVLDHSDPEARLVEQRLLRHLRRAQFRPRMDEGKLRTSDVVQARFYYTY